jgi:hypothetical protein
MLPEGANISALTKPLAEEIPTRDWDRVVRFVLAWFATQRDNLLELPATSIPEELEIDFDAVNWSKRTENCLCQQDLHNKVNQLRSITYKDLLEIPNMGDRSALDFAVMLELWAQSEQSPGGKKMAVGSAESSTEDNINYLLSVADRPWADEISRKDPRFTSMISLGSGSLRDSIEDAVSQNDLLSIQRLRKTLPDIERKIIEIDSMNLEEALLDLIHSFPKLSEERGKILSYRFGFHGKKPETLEEVGMRLGVSRERIRQLEKKIIDRLPDHPIYLPQLKEAASILEDLTPLPIADAIRELKDRGLTGISFHPKSIISSCKFCRQTTSIKVQSIHKKQMVTARTSEKVALRLLTIARLKAGASGATDIEEVIDLAHFENLNFERNRAIKLLKSMPEIEWINSNWFWVPSLPLARNRLRNGSRRMLSVASPIHVKKLRDGIRRHARFRNSGRKEHWEIRVPPIAVFHEFYRLHNEFEIDDEGFVAPTNPLDYTKELGGSERVLVDVIRSTPTSILDRFAFRLECQKRGMNVNTFEAFMQCSPIIEHVDTNIWTLRGLTVDPAQVEAARTANAERPRQKRVTSFGWTESGEVSITVRVPANPTPSFVFLAPAGISRFVSGKEFEVVRPTDVQGRRLKILDEGNVIGSGVILNRLGADEGDVVNFNFNLTKNIVSIDIDSAETFDLE